MTNSLIYIAIIAGMLLLPSIWRLTLAVWGSVFQFYTIPVFGFYPSLALLSTLSLSPKVVLLKRTLTQLPVALLIILMALQALSLLWSSDSHLGIATILYEMPFLILYVIAFNVAMIDPRKLCNILKVYAVLSLVPLAAIIIFSLWHELDPAFLKSSLAKLVINPNSLTRYLSLPGHDQWSGKPNGFFTNQNVGGAYLGICALLLWGAGTYLRTNWMKMIAVLHWGTLFFTLSFAASILAIILPITIISTFLFLKNKPLLSIKIYLRLAGFFISSVLIGVIIFLKKPLILGYAIQKFKSRLIFWKVAANFLPHHFLLGLGFGGWAIAYKKFSALPFPPIPISYLKLLEPNLPPHNSLLMLWAESGILASLVGLLFMMSLIGCCWKALRLISDPRTTLFALCVSASIAWVLLQGMAENWGVIGEMHIQPILAVSFGLMMGLCEQKKQAEVIPHSP